jgi:DNA-binding CsgD family transcriptional regulator
MISPASDDRVIALLRRAQAAPAIYRRLQACSDVGELYARASEVACAECGFARAVILSVNDTRITASASQMLRDEESDRLRRSVLRSPLDLSPGTFEAELLRLATSERSAQIAGPSQLATALGLDHWALGVIAPESRPLALLVVDRSDRPVDELDRAVIEAFAAIVAVALEVVVLRGRVSEFATELRHVTTFVQAMTGEMLTAPVGLLDRGSVTAFPLRGPLDTTCDARARQLRGLLTEREATIAALLTEGRSNREIAAQLFVSPETVKMHVARILRKLNASNRVEAAARMLELGHSDRAATAG